MRSTGAKTERKIERIPQTQRRSSLISFDLTPPHRERSNASNESRLGGCREAGPA
jgi:hypothetical protein